MAGDFFPTLRELRTAFGSLETINLQMIYRFLVSEEIREQDDNDPTVIGDERRLIPLGCELENPAHNWPEAWRRAGLKGLGPELTTHVLKMMWGILPTRKRLHRILPKLYLTPVCPLCNQEGRGPTEDIRHALMDCKANGATPANLMTLLRLYQPGITATQVLALDLEIDSSMELPLVWIMSTSLLLVCTLTSLAIRTMIH